MHLDAPVRRITTWLAMLGYTLVASGLPLPLGITGEPMACDTAAARRLASKDRSRPFPCMDKPCGCDSADRCFTNCCCRGPAETLAWAKLHGVEPALLAALERRVDLPPPDTLTAPPSKSSCCATVTPPAKASCCATAAETEIPAMPEARGDDRHLTAVPAPATDIPAAAQPGSRTLVLRAMLACGGIVTEWFMAAAALPPPRIEVALLMRVLETTAAADETGDGLRAAPAAPPPRAA